MVATRTVAPTRRQVNRVMGIYVCYQFLNNFGLGVFTLLFNLYLRKLGLREDFIGLFNALSTLTWAAGALSAAIRSGTSVSRWRPVSP